MIKFADVWERNHIRVANTLTLLALILYAVLRFAHIAYEGQMHRLSSISIVMAVMAASMILTALFSKTVEHLATFMPLSLVLGLFLSAIFNDGSPYIYMGFVGASAICGVYFNIRAFIKFVLTINIGIFILKVMLGISMTGPYISYSVSYAMWAMALLCIIVVFVMVRYMESRYRLSRRSMGSYHAMLASTPNLVALVDGENRIYHISDKLAELASVQRLDMVLGRPILDVFDNPDMIDMIAEALDAGAPYENTATIRLDDKGGHVHYKITSTSMYSAMGDLSFIDIADITPIMNARYEAESASRAKSDFLSKMSHEIRTPLNGIMGMAEVMSYENIAHKTRDQLETIKHSGNHLLSIINNILDFSKIEHGKLEVVPKYYHFNSLINDVISIITMQMKGTANLQLTVYVSRNIPEELFGDVVRIRQILLNILSNAVKYTKEGYVSLEVTGFLNEGNMIDIAFKVTDTGVGLKPEDIQTLYDEFVQFDMDRHHGVEGTGLGLAITYSLVEIMKGWIDVKSTYGEGSTFTVTLPQRYRRLGTLASVVDRENKNVLIYGVSQVYAKSIIRALDDLGVRHYTAESETELYYKLSEKIWNFVFSASNLAWQVESMCKRIAEAKGVIAPSIVMVTDSRSTGLDNDHATLVMPAYALPILDVLNYAQNTDVNSDISTKNIASFIAPDAKVLVVDDISTNLKVAKGLLAIYEMQVDICESGLEALAAVKAIEYDLVLMDHMMPGMDGVATMEAIREMDGGRYARAPIVALTANTIVGTMEMLMAKGFDDFLAKPIDVAKLNIILERWISREKQVANATVGAAPCHPEPNVAESVHSLEIGGIDVTKGMRMAGGAMQAYLEILDVFCKDGAKKITEIKKCLAVGDLRLYTIHVHALKVALANVGAISLSKHAQALENAGNSEDMAYIANSGNDFIQNLEELMVNISIFMLAQSAGNLAESNSMTATDMTKALKTLKAALIDFDPAAIDASVATLRAATNMDVDGILKDVLVGDYDSAIEKIDDSMV